MFEEYCALAEYVAEDNSQVSFQPGEKVLVMSKDESGKSLEKLRTNTLLPLVGRDELV